MARSSLLRNVAIPTLQYGAFCIKRQGNSYRPLTWSLLRIPHRRHRHFTPAQILATPANPLAKDGAGRVTVGANAAKNEYNLAANQSSVTVGTVNNLINPPPDCARSGTMNV